MLTKDSYIGIKRRIKNYWGKKTNTIFDDFYGVDLDFFEECTNRELKLLNSLEVLKEKVISQIADNESHDRTQAKFDNLYTQFCKNLKLFKTIKFIDLKSEKAESIIGNIVTSLCFGMDCSVVFLLVSLVEDKVVGRALFTCYLEFFAENDFKVNFDCLSEQSDIGSSGYVFQNHHKSCN